MPDEIPRTKVCSKCGTEKDLDEFSPSKKGKFGRHSWCKKCKTEVEIARYRENPDVSSRKLQQNKDKIASETPEDRELRIGKMRQNRDANKEEINRERRERYQTDEEFRIVRLASRKRYYYDNQDAILVRSSEQIASRTDEQKQADRLKDRAYYEAHREQMISDAVAWRTQKIKTDVCLRISSNLRSRLYRALNKGWKTGSAVGDLGCSIPEFKSHLESKFTPGMTWENYGKGPGKWNIDHIVPLSAFDLTNRQHVVLVCHYLNLQPLWFEDNMSKGGVRKPRRRK